LILSVPQLSISRTIVAGHGGRIWGENNRDHGAFMHSVLPLTQVHYDGSVNHPVSRSDSGTMSTPPASAPRRISIAVVDDDASVRVSLRRLCEVFGLSATAYASGREFLASLADGAPAVDCLLLDAHMPGMTGAELHHQLVAKGLRIPTIVFTGDDPPEALPEQAAARIVAYLRKPLASKELFAAIEQAVRTREQMS
jgi:CheY-like chemotaxis protein